MNDLIYAYCTDTLKLAHNAMVAQLIGKDAKIEIANLVSACKYLEALLGEFGLNEKIVEKDDIDQIEKKDLEAIYRKIAKIMKICYEARSVKA
ncbi:MAG: hypothetical protein QXR93_07585 [Archaeoglobaceae archaeon]